MCNSNDLKELTLSGKAGPVQQLEQSAQAERAEHVVTVTC